jgi:hypothetical protein
MLFNVIFIIHKIYLSKTCSCMRIHSILEFSDITEYKSSFSDNLFTINAI